MGGNKLYGQHSVDRVNRDGIDQLRQMRKATSPATGYAMLGLPADLHRRIASRQRVYQAEPWFYDVGRREEYGVIDQEDQRNR